MDREFEHPSHETNANVMSTIESMVVKFRDPKVLAQLVNTANDPLVSAGELLRLSNDLVYAHDEIVNRRVAIRQGLRTNEGNIRTKKLMELKKRLQKLFQRAGPPFREKVRGIAEKFEHDVMQHTLQQEEQEYTALIQALENATGIISAARAKKEFPNSKASVSGNELGHDTRSSIEST